MKCGNCDKTDGLCYTSLPPKVKCTVTGKFHECGDECDCITDDVCSSDIKEGKRFWPASVAKISITTYCIVCDAPVELTPEEGLRLERGHHIGSKVCDKCKQAIMHVRNHLDI